MILGYSEFRCNKCFWIWVYVWYTSSCPAAWSSITFTSCNWFLRTFTGTVLGMWLEHDTCNKLSFILTPSVVVSLDLPGLWATNKGTRFHNPQHGNPIYSKSRVIRKIMGKTEETSIRFWTMEEVWNSTHSQTWNERWQGILNKTGNVLIT